MPIHEVKIVLDKALSSKPESKWNTAYDKFVGAVVLALVMGAVALGWSEWTETGKNFLAFNKNFEKQEELNVRLQTLETLLLERLTEVEANNKEQGELIESLYKELDVIREEETFIWANEKLDDNQKEEKDRLDKLLKEIDKRVLEQHSVKTKESYFQYAK